MSRRLLSALFTVLALLPFAKTAFAQIDTGAIVGRVKTTAARCCPA